MNAEAFGYETDLPWRMGIHISNFSDPSVSEIMAVGKYYHPTFLYESLWNLVGFLIINAVYKKKKFDGQIFFMYIGWYGFGRMFIEGLRTDSLYLGPIRISQLIGALAFVTGVVLLIVFAKRARQSAELPACVSTLDIGSDDVRADALDEGIGSEGYAVRDTVEKEQSSDGEENGKDN